MPRPPFQTLIDAHGRAVHRFLIARVGAVDADDCWQETFIAALRAYPRSRVAADPRPWLLTIAHRKAIDHLRARARRAVPHPDPGAEIPGAAPEDSWDLIWQEVATLPDKQRTAVALRFLGELSHAEIAATMSISEAAARRNVHEGLARLRRDLTRRREDVTR